MSEHAWMHIIGTGMVTPVGENAVTTAAAVASEVSAVREIDILNKKLTPIKMAQVPDGALPPINEKLKEEKKISQRQQRLLCLAAAALVQLADVLPAGQTLPLYLALPEHLPNHAIPPLHGNFIEQLALQSGLRLNAADSLIADIGRAGSFYAIEKAMQYFEQSGNDYLLIGGVDTYWDPALLARLDAEDRLNVLGNFDGFFPGEGAAFLLLASERVNTRHIASPVRLYRPGTALEEGHLYSEAPYRGDGLANAVREAIQQAAPARVQSIWSSMTYESYGSKEFGVALTRSSAQFADPLDIQHPVDCFGDMGAATGCAMIGMIAAKAAAPVGFPHFQHYLLCCSSDQPHRAAVRLDVG
ncbi:hypothetical protein MNBD_GAMMA17-1622 [hydrothermal vent metagenome]|uniref:Beta-ketoacyl synthase N-terminal domain-containing protein n=1 Tax=hydrothermal vent metagenome TaxID=652676 RepID=A0A3B1AB95_9ZZZZ